MGLLTIIRKQKIKDQELRILTLGLDNSGKTTIVKQLLGEDINTISPTMGFQINSLQHEGFTLNIWDIGGQTTIRNFWGNYYDKTNAVIWVIDGLSMERLEESSSELREKVLQQDRLVGMYLMILVNKVDLLDPSTYDSLRDLISSILDLGEIMSQTDRCSLHLVSGKTGYGLQEVLHWLVTRDY